MAIEVACACGKRLRARDEMAGKRAKCPGCGAKLTVPNPQLEDDLYALVDEPPVAKAAATVVAPLPRPAAAVAPLVRPIAPIARPTTTTASRLPLDRGDADAPAWRHYTYMLLLLTMLPLAWITFVSERIDGKALLERTVQAHPEILPEIAKLDAKDEVTDDEFFEVLPDHRLDGALLAHESKMHWLFAALSGGAFFGAVSFLFPKYRCEYGKLLGVAVFTATIGIVFLLAVQWIAEATYGRIFYGRSIIVLFFYIVKFIGFSYHAALDPETNFFVSMFGFTFGVGMCEELVKAMPLLFHYKSGSGSLGWRGACLWGLISGVGFGVSEGVTYAGGMYNGVLGADIYWVRFVSCVALHAIWSGAAGIMIYKHQNLLHDSESIWGLMAQSVALIAVPMILHGLYDTLLKKEHDALALAAAVASFAWFAYQVESTRRKYDEDHGAAPAAA